MHRINTDDTIAAIATPVGEGGIGIVRLSGPLSLSIVEKLFNPASGSKLSKSRTHTIHYGRIKDPKTLEIIDEVIVTVMRAPKSYTREDVVEINCHGGLQSVKRVLELMLSDGARMAEPGEFTKRAFLNGRIDLAQAEAVIDVIRSKTEGSLKVAMNQLEGGLSGSINDIREEMLDIVSVLEASIDFPEEDLDGEKGDGSIFSCAKNIKIEPSPFSAKAKILKGIDKTVGDLGRLIDTYGEGSILREGVLAVILGKPNVGKSSLMNLLLKRDRVIVSPIPGTTRDAVEEMISLKGIPIRLVDTAGITETEDPLGKESMIRSKRYLAMADIVILLLDYSAKIEEADRDIIRICAGKKKVVVLNKTDLPGKIDMEDVRKLIGVDNLIEISVEKRENIALLERELSGAIWSGGFNQAEPAILSNVRHKELLDKALASMLSVKKAFVANEHPEITAIELKEAITALGLVTGKTISDDILDRIFERFCIGK